MPSLSRLAQQWRETFRSRTVNWKEFTWPCNSCTETPSLFSTPSLQTESISQPTVKTLSLLGVVIPEMIASVLPFVMVLNLLPILSFFHNHQTSVLVIIHGHSV